MSLLPKNEKVDRSKDQAIKLLLYGESGIGKSYFANNFPEPLILSTDGNYVHTSSPALVINNWKAEKERGMTDEDYKELQKRSFVDVVMELLETNGGGFKTIIVDLIDDVYDQAREYYLDEFGLKHENDLDWGAGYDLIRKPFISVIKNLQSLPVNIILISHEDIKKRKNRIGVQYDYILPIIPEKVARKIASSGFALRAYWNETGTVETGSTLTRMLSMGSKSDELSVIRFIDADGKAVSPDDIELDYDTFIQVLEDVKDPENVGVFKEVETETKKTPPKRRKKATPKKEVVEEAEEEGIEDDLIDEDELEEIKKKPIPKKRIPKKKPEVEEVEENEEELEEDVSEEEVEEEVKEVPKKKPTTKKKETKKERLERLRAKRSSNQNVEEDNQEDELEYSGSDISDEKRAALEAIKAKYKNR